MARFYWWSIEWSRKSGTEDLCLLNLIQNLINRISQHSKKSNFYRKFGKITTIAFFTCFLIVSFIHLFKRNNNNLPLPKWDQTIFFHG